MGAFELNTRNAHDDDCGCDESPLSRLREECIIALKVYDQCRRQECLTPAQLGPARAAENKVICGNHIHEGDIIDPPDRAATVTIDRLRVKKVLIIDKQPNQFKNGYWDIDLKYVFEYRLTFREADGCVIETIRANNIYNKQVTLFGSLGSDIVLATDLFGGGRRTETDTLDADPFVLVEAKAIALEARIKHGHCREDGLLSAAPSSGFVEVTLGLFTIIKLFRIVQLRVESRGFCIPPECEDIEPIHPCEFFRSLDFPMDIFAPPQKPEFQAGISGNIPAGR